MHEPKILYECNLSNFDIEIWLTESNWIEKRNLQTIAKFNAVGIGFPAARLAVKLSLLQCDRVFQWRQPHGVRLQSRLAGRSMAHAARF